MQFRVDPGSFLTEGGTVDYMEVRIWTKTFLTHQKRNIGSDQSAKNADNAVEEYRKRLPQPPNTPEADAQGEPSGNG